MTADVIVKADLLEAEDLKALVRSVPDFPKPGILFRDITTLIGHGAGFAASVRLLADRAEAAGRRPSRAWRRAASSSARRWRRGWACLSCRCASRASCRCR
jgi:hypothetical protein